MTDPRDIWQQRATRELKTDEHSALRLQFGPDRYIEPVYFASPSDPIEWDQILFPSGAPELAEQFSHSEDKPRLMQSLEQGLQHMIVENADNETWPTLIDGVHLDWIKASLYLAPESTLTLPDSVIKRSTRLGLESDYVHISDTMDPVAALSVLSVQLDKANHDQGSSERFIWQIPADSHHLVLAAKVRAARALHQSKAPNLGFEVELRITPRDTDFGMQQIDLTHRMLGAILASCDRIVLAPSSKTNIDRLRTIRNTYYLLTEESKLKEISDPWRGSYLIEHMVSQFVLWALQDAEPS